MATNTTYTAYSGYANATITVTNTAELNAALANLSSSGGGTILLDGNGGPYSISGSGIGGVNNPILIQAADPANQPIVQSVFLNNSSYIAMTDLHVDSTGTGSTVHDVRFSNSDHIEFVGNVMTSNADGYLDGTGSATKGASAALIRDSSDIVFSNNYIADYAGGVGFLEVNGFDFSNNEMTGIQYDGIHGGGLQNAVIADNYMHDFYGSVQTINHSDFIQIWATNANSVTTNVQISGNIMDTGSGAAYQGIFIGSNQLGNSGPSGQYFQDISVFDNVIHTSMWHGISVGATQNAQIFDNTVLFNAASFTQASTGAPLTQAEPWIMASNAPNAQVFGNVAGKVSVNGTPSNTQNYIIDYHNTGAANYVDNHIVNLTGGGDLDLRDLAILPSSHLFGNFGSNLSSTADPNDPVVAVMRAFELEGFRGAVQLTADLSLEGGAPIDPATTTYVWLLDDGTVINGVGGTHVFQTPGLHSITLQVTNQNGQVDTITRVVDVLSSENFDIDFDINGAQDDSGLGAAISVQDPNGNAFVQGVTGQGFHLYGNSLLNISKTNDQLFNLDTFDIDVSFKLDAAGDNGTLLGLHTVFGLKVLGNGALEFKLVTDQGNFIVVTSAGALPDSAWHDISVNYDGPASTLEISVDGVVLGSTFATGTTAAAGSHGLVLGYNWGTSVTGVVDDFHMASNPSSIYDNLTSSGTVVNPPTSGSTGGTGTTTGGTTGGTDTSGTDTSGGTTGGTDTSTGSTDTSTGGTDTSTGGTDTSTGGTDTSTGDTDTTTGGNGSGGGNGGGGKGSSHGNELHSIFQKSVDTLFSKFNTQTMDDSSIQTNSAGQQLDLTVQDLIDLISAPSGTAPVPTVDDDTSEDILVDAL